MYRSPIIPIFLSDVGFNPGMSDLVTIRSMITDHMKANMREKKGGMFIITLENLLF